MSQQATADAVAMVLKAGAVESGNRERVDEKGTLSPALEVRGRIGVHGNMYSNSQRDGSHKEGRESGEGPNPNVQRDIQCPH